MGDYEFRGLDELRAIFVAAANQYPYESEKKLLGIGNKFRREVIKKTPDSGKQNKSKLRKKYKTEIKGYGEYMQLNFWSNAPHFHLIERGHKNIAKDGREYGFTPGIHMVERTVQEFEEVVPQEVEKFLDKVIDRMER